MTSTGLRRFRAPATVTAVVADSGGPVDAVSAFVAGGGAAASDGVPHEGGRSGPLGEEGLPLPVGARREGAGGGCEMCGGGIAEEHRHVVDLESRGMLCACRDCALLLSRDAAPAARHRLVPCRRRHLPAMRLSAAEWDELRIPVRVAFLFHNTSLGRAVACYPSPAGATESLPPHEAWERMLAANPEVADVRPDVEALLIDGRMNTFACHLLPIDACYRLTGLIRLHWKGFDGGQEVWRAVDDFLTALPAQEGDTHA